MSIAMQNQIAELAERVRVLEEAQAGIPRNGSDVSIEIRIQSLEDKYKAMNARMGKKTFVETIMGQN